MAGNFAKIRGCSDSLCQLPERSQLTPFPRFSPGLALEFLSRIRQIEPQPLPLLNHPFTPQSMKLTPSSLIEVKRVPGKGRGVFAKEFIPEGTVFERVPVLVLPAKEVLPYDEGGVLWQYVFEYGRNNVALALGFGSLYNHSYSPNARYDDAGRQIKEYKALRDIQKGEEITINYNGSEDCMDPVDFDVLEA
jgi:hypothetical protein